MKNKGVWSKFKKVLPIIGVAIFVYIILKLDLSKIIESIKEAKLIWLIISVLFLFVYFILQTYKWFLIAKFQKIPVLFKEALRINLITFLYGFITPSRVGSVLRADYLKKYAKNIGKGISNFVIEKVIDVAALFSMAIVFGFAFRDKFSFDMSYLIIVFVVFVALSLIFIKKQRSKAFLKLFFRKFVPKKYKEEAKITFDSFYEDMPKKRYLFLVFLVTVLTWITNYTMVYFIGVSLGITLGIIPFMAILPLSTLIAQIPITIAGLGTREATMISLFGLFGVGAVKVFSMSLIGLVLGGVIPSIIAIFLILKNKDKG